MPFTFTIPWYALVMLGFALGVVAIVMVVQVRADLERYYERKLRRR